MKSILNSSKTMGKIRAENKVKQSIPVKFH